MIYIGDIYYSESAYKKDAILDHILEIKNNKVISLFYSYPGKRLNIYNEHELDMYINIYYKLE